MAELTFDDVKENSSSTLQQSLPDFKIADGESAIVRLIHPSKESFKIYSVHKVPLTTQKGKNWFPTVNCLRQVGEDATACPLCAAKNDKYSTVTPTCYIRMVQYEFGKDGSMTAKAVVWGRNAIFVKNSILPLVSEYGAKLPNTVVKITRTGSKFNDTKYDITVCNQENYPIERYPLDAASAFDNYNELGTNIWDKTFDDLCTYVETEQFPYGNAQAAPSREQQEANGYRIPTQDEIAASNAAMGPDEVLPFSNVPPAQYAPAPQPAPQPNVAMSPQPAPAAPAPQAAQTTPWAQPDGNRPVRRYS